MLRVDKHARTVLSRMRRRRAAHPESAGAAWAGAGAGGRAGTPPAEATQCLWRLCRRRAARPSPVSRTLLRAERAERRGR